WRRCMNPAGLHPALISAILNLEHFVHMRTGGAIMRMTRRALMQGALGGAAMLSFPVGARANTAFNFITPFTFSLAFSPVLYGDAAGYFADEGLEMNVQAGKGAALAAQMTIAGQMDSGRTGGTNYMISRV